MLIQVAVRSKASVCGRSLAGITGLDPSAGHGCPRFGVLSGGSLIVGLITRPEKSYRVWSV